jgi:hypothetical protein
MRPTLTAIALLFATAVAIGAPPEKVTVDLLRFTPPLGWKVETKQNTYTSYTTVGVCQQRCPVNHSSSLGF